jgi:hypothetical protein
MNHLARGCSLIDSEARRRAYPDTWDYPTEQQLNRIAPGCAVKICVNVEDERCWEQVQAEAKKAGIESALPRGERFWTRVLQITAAGFKVKVEQCDMLLSGVHGVRDGDILTIERRHVLDIDDDGLSRSHQ